MSDIKWKVLSLKSSDKKKNYFHVILNNGSKYNFHENSIIRYNIKQNQSIDDKTINEALNNTEKEIIKNKIIILLSYRLRSKKELKDAFLSKGYKIENILNVIEELEQREYLNDSLFAKMMALHLIKEKKLGRYLVEQKLFQHNIDSSVMEPIISDLYQEYPPSKTIKEILNKKKNILGKSLKNKIKIINHLKRKGFHFDDINSIIESYNM